MTSTSRNDATPRIVAAVLAASLAAILLICFSGGISGNDFWWHVKVGEYIVRERSVPTTDIFSWYGQSEGIRWTPHEWLADVFFYLLFSAGGEAGVFLFSLLAAALMVFLLAWQCRRAVLRCFPVGAAFLALFAVLASLFFYGRPHIFSFFLLFAELKILYGFLENERSPAVFALPALAALWSNLHGGSANLSYLLCAVFLAAGAFKARVGRLEARRLTGRGLARLSAVTLLCALAILVNPVGREVFVYPYASFGDKLSMAVISEWHAPDAKLLGNLLLYFLPIGTITLCMLSSERTVRLADVAVMGVFLLLFFRSVRFIPMWYIAAAFYSPDYWPPCAVKPVRSGAEKAAAAALFALLLVAMGLGAGRMAGTLQKGGAISRALSDETAERVRAEDPQRLFNDYNLGEALIYRDIPVFFDARADLYAARHIMDDGVSLLFLEQARQDAGEAWVDVEALVSRYGFDGMLLLKTRPLYAYLMSHPDRYTLLFEDGSVGYFRVNAAKGEERE